MHSASSNCCCRCRFRCSEASRLFRRPRVDTVWPSGPPSRGTDRRWGAGPNNRAGKRGACCSATQRTTQRGALHLVLCGTRSKTCLCMFLADVPGLQYRNTGLSKRLGIIPVHWPPQVITAVSPMGHTCPDLRGSYAKGAYGATGCYANFVLDQPFQNPISPTAASRFPTRRSPRDGSRGTRF